MSGLWKYGSVCIAAILVVMMAGVPVTAAGSGKMAVPGIENAMSYGGSKTDYGHSVRNTNDGGYVVVGTTWSDDGDAVGQHGPYGRSDIWVLKFAPNGICEWQRFLGGSGSEEWNTIIEQVSDGGYIIAGSTRSHDGNITNNPDPTYESVWVVKLSSEGAIEWDKCYGGSGSDYGVSIQQTKDGGFICAARTESTDGDINGYYGSTDIWIFKIDSAGNLIWQKCLGGSSPDSPEYIELTPDGGYICIGNTMSTDNDVLSYHGGVGYDIWVVKLSEDGMIQWQKCYGGTGFDTGKFIRTTKEGGYIFIGYTESTDGDVSKNHGDADIWVVKIDTDGSIQWQKCFGGTSQESANSIEQTSDGGYILCGRAASVNGDLMGKQSGKPIWIVKINNQGMPLWQKSVGGSSFGEGYSIQQRANGAFILTGEDSSINGDIPNHHGNEYTPDMCIVELYPPPVVNGIAPSRVTAGMNPTIIITGENLVQGFVPATVKLIKPGTPDITLPVNQFSLSGTYLQCQPATDTFVTPGNYTLRVMTNDSQYINVPDAFTVTCGPAPKVTSMTPTSGIQGSPVNPVTIKGSGFWTAGGVTAYLNRTGQANINARVTGASGIQITAEILVPAGAATGKWNLVVKNPDGQYAMKKDAFTVTLRTFKPPRVSSVTPKTVAAGSKVFINGIAGSFFNSSATVAMTGLRGVSIPVSNVTVLSDTKITCDANLTSIAKGYATVTVTNPDGKKSTRARAFSIK